MIRARHVSYRALGRSIVDDVSLDVASGELVALVGPNGAGKSTFFRLLAGEISPRTGTIEVAGLPVGESSSRALARVRAVMPQESVPGFSFDAGEVVSLGRLPHSEGEISLQDEAIARLAMQATGTLELHDRAFPRLSGGERQRVNAARVFAQVWESSLGRTVLLDEPTASLDLAHQHEVLALAQRFAREGCAVVCVLHDLNLAARYADRMVVMHGGRLVAVGRPRDVLTVELLADVFAVEAVVLAHAVHAFPLVVPIGPLSSSVHSDHTRASRQGALR
jgi:iron complex transport system ATP-binding protein